MTEDPEINRVPGKDRNNSHKNIKCFINKPEEKWWVFEKLFATQVSDRYITNLHKRKPTKGIKMGNAYKSIYQDNLKLPTMEYVQCH